MKNEKLQEEQFGVTIREENGNIVGLRLKCPHCGMVDMRFSTQGIKDSLWRNCSVGGIHKYECGKCRRIFRTIELVCPTDIPPELLFEAIGKAMKPGGARNAFKG